ADPRRRGGTDRRSRRRRTGGGSGRRAAPQMRSHGRWYVRADRSPSAVAGCHGVIVASFLPQHRTLSANLAAGTTVVQWSQHGTWGGTGLMKPTIEIVDRGCGPQLSASRITVMDVFYYLHRGYDFD